MANAKKNSKKVVSVSNDTDITVSTPTVTELDSEARKEMLFKAKVDLTFCADNIRSNYVKIGEILHLIKVNKLCEKAEDFQDIISETLDMSAPTAYRILSTYEKFYLPLSKESDEKTVSALTGFKDSTLSRLLPLGDYTTIKKYIINGDFKTTMSAREVTDKVSDILGKNKDKEKYNDKDKDKVKDEDKVKEYQTTEEFTKNENPSDGKYATFDSEVYALINEIISATSLIEVQNKIKAFKDRWFK